MPAKDDPDLTVVYTDGACLGNPGPGGWAWALGPTHYRSGNERQTTNQRMELTAVLRALQELDGPVQVVSDSTYVVNCFRDKWWRGWRSRGWRNSKGMAVANRDLWEPLISIVVDLRPADVSFKWVKGHATNEGNNLVDRLANEAARLQAPSAAG
ncbi:MAG TPA: ribonuclease H [Acidimicrobiales bacterium]|jgi:ribonuclease HI|nr:ribonuclease H [Acidimicrobiales bacterium]